MIRCCHNLIITIKNVSHCVHSLFASYYGTYTFLVLKHVQGLYLIFMNDWSRLSHNWKSISSTGVIDLLLILVLYSIGLIMTQPFSYQLLWIGCFLPWSLVFFPVRSSRTCVTSFFFFVCENRRRTAYRIGHEDADLKSTDANQVCIKLAGKKKISLQPGTLNYIRKRERTQEYK